MSVLSSLLARDQVVPVKKIEEAIQRQVISGGELPTVLLEVGAAGENVIAAYHASALGLTAASRDDVMTSSADNIRLVSRALAEQHGVVPIGVEPNALVVAAAKPLDDAALAALAQGTGRRIVLRIVTEPRIAAGLSAHYQVQPIARMRRLATKLESQDPGELRHVAPLLDNRIERASLAPAPTSGRPSAVSSWARNSNAGEAADGPGTAPTSSNTRGVAAKPASAAAEPIAPAAPADKKKPAVVTMGVAKVVGTSSAGAVKATDSRAVSYGHGRKMTTAGVPFTPIASPDDEPATPPAPEPSEAPEAAQAKPTTEILETTEVHANRAEPAEPAQGPITLDRSLDADEAVAALATAESRDAILAIAFAHVRTHFEYCAIFSARDEEAEGRDSHGDGASPEEVRRITLDLEKPGTVRDVRQLVGAKAGVLDSTEADRDLVQRLDRTAKQPSVIVPVAIRQRLVLLIYGDRGGKALGIGDLGDLMSFLPRVSDALQRLILQRKRGSGRSGQPGPASWAKGGQPLASGERDSFPPDDERTSAPDAPVATAESAPPSDDDASAKSGKPSSDRPAEFDLLRVPRKAPLPPDVSGPRPEPAPTPEPAAAAPSATTRQSVLPGKPVESTTYRVQGGEEEVVLTRKKRRSVRPESAPPPAQATPREGQLESDRPEGPPTDPTPGPNDPSSIPDVSIPPSARVPAEAKHSSSFDDDDDGPNIEVNEGTPPVESDATIITDIGLDLDDVVDELIRAPKDLLDRKIGDLVGFGEPALRVLSRRFPGPQAAGTKPGPQGPHPKPRDADPVLAAMIGFRQLAVPHVVALLDHREAETRYFATLVATEILHRDLVVRIGRRVLDDDASVRAVAISALRAAKRFESEVAEVLAHFRRVGGNDRAPVALRKLAVELLGELRDGDAVNVLTDVLAENDAELSRIAHKSLVRITKRDLGVSAAAWETWVSRAGSAHRIEWLIDALTSDDDTLRREAGEELKNLTKEYFGFQSALPRKELEVVQRKYRRWWENIGRTRFVRH